ncbi:hypothetical protein E3E14_27385 [Streptomyces sp. ICN441]|uniref:Uncharacterized protein n=1 Tax=Streptomyces tirandamycinicus TaxID=2174846 RepID=A0A2S1SMR9_9ACTN|nr:hypothetical protein DDW44_01820 [Streptomyces tirandamycinicus]TFE38710.1 hypothetical protein E3E14_27385 [Streptomyces sp. ICN441]
MSLHGARIEHWSEAGAIRGLGQPAPPTGHERKAVGSRRATGGDGGGRGAPAGAYDAVAGGAGRRVATVAGRGTAEVSEVTHSGYLVRRPR